MVFRLTRMVRRMLSSSSVTLNSEMAHNYQNAVRALNGLQSNAAAIEKSRKILKQKNDEHYETHMAKTMSQMESFINRTGLQLEDLSKLSIIHVSGTKGKGSTCAFCESILRAQGLKTGFFSSPHLIEVRERIRINGQPLPKDTFADYFWKCYNALESSKEAHNNSMPAYFRFLTVMAFHVFLEERVDVAVIEVGIGGQYDSTNIIRLPVVCGVSSLGLDHTNILGETLEKIAWNKAGIFKPGVPAVTVPQPANTIDVLIGRAKEIGSKLFVIPKLDAYNWNDRAIELGIAGEMQHLNASLALQLCNIWMSTKGKPTRDCPYDGQDITTAQPFDITDRHWKGLKRCKWPGRNQLIKRKGVSYYLDGAHTPRSMQQCVNWFMKESEEERKGIKGKVTKILLFNSTGDRKPPSLLQPLLTCDFDCAVFCPNMTLVVQKTDDDQANMMVSTGSMMSRCLMNKNSWEKLLEQYAELHKDDARHQFTPFQVEELRAIPIKCSVKEVNKNSDKDGEVMKKYLSQGFVKFDVNGASGDSIERIANGIRSCNGIHVQQKTANCDNDFKDQVIFVENNRDEHISSQSKPLTQTPIPVVTFPCILQALRWSSQNRNAGIPKLEIKLPPFPDCLQDAEHIQILVTGSLHLVGGVLKVIDPELLGF